MATITVGAYFDESYSGRVMAIGGYLSTIERWCRFQDEWQDFLTAFGIESFHMKDFKAGQRQFKNWTAEQRRRCIDWYTGIIARRTWLRLAVAVDRKALEELSHGVSEIGGFGFCVFQ